VPQPAGSSSPRMLLRGAPSDCRQSVYLSGVEPSTAVTKSHHLLRTVACSKGDNHHQRLPLQLEPLFTIKRPGDAAAVITDNDHAEPDREHTLRSSGSNGPASSGEHVSLACTCSDASRMLDVLRTLQPRGRNRLWGSPPHTSRAYASRRVIEPMISLAFAIHSNRGVYAPLLGSGVSRAAGVPTGWEIVLDLIERVAVLHGEETQGDPEGWYRAQYDADPSYSVLLGELAGTAAERSQLLRSYFEPSEDEREQGLKVPTAAHHALARLVQAGYVRVLVTTNFDRLLEQALEAVGVNPSVIATPDAVEGALPIAHTQCTILKLHGDYLDTRVLNTAAELAAYDDRVDALLDRILDEYGLVICGWSGDWDTALVDAITRCPSHRFTTYWASVLSQRFVSNMLRGW
jgi:SIR2-like domain